MNCPFCGCDPFHYVHNGLGMEAVAVTCCDLGVEYFNRDPEPSDTIEIGRDDFREIAEKLNLLQRILEAASDLREAGDKGRAALSAPSGAVK